MLESERLLLNIKATHQQIVDVGRMDLNPNEKARILYRLDREKSGYEAALLVELSKQNGATSTD